MPGSSNPYSNYDALLAAARAERNPSTQPTTSGLSAADIRQILDIILPPVALVPGGQQDFTKQMFAPILPAISGIVGGVEGGWDGARAGWQAQVEAQNRYEAQHPVLAGVAALTGPGSLDWAVKGADSVGGILAALAPNLTKRILSDSAKAQALAAAQQAAAGAAKFQKANDIYNLGAALLQNLVPGHAQQSLPPNPALPNPRYVPAPPSPSRIGILGPLQSPGSTSPLNPVVVTPSVNADFSDQEDD